MLRDIWTFPLNRYPTKSRTGLLPRNIRLSYLLLVPEYSRFPSLESRSSKFQGWTVDVQLYIITCNCPARMIEIEIRFLIQSRKNTLTASYNDNLSFSTVKIAVREAMILITHKFRHCVSFPSAPVFERGPFSHRSRAALPHRKHKSKPRLPRSSTYFATRAGLITSTIARRRLILCLPSDPRLLVMEEKRRRSRSQILRCPLFVLICNNRRIDPWDRFVFVVY